MTARPGRAGRLAALPVAAFLLGPAFPLDAESGEIAFREVAAEWGLDFRHTAAFTGRHYMVETMGGGVVLFDYDGDGDEDAFFIDGGTLPGYEGPTPRSRLLRNEAGGDGPRFVDVTDEAGIDFGGYGIGGAASDVDGDGDLDLYVTALGSNELFLNLGDGSFRAAGAERGVADPRWSASAAFGDLDLDGDPDLYVTNYTDFSLSNHKACGLSGGSEAEGGESSAGEAGYCHPDIYNGVQDRVYRNDGSGHFVDATVASGLDGPAEAGLGVVIGDLDGDRWPDIYVANDKDPNLLFRNLGGGRFEDESLLSGAAFDRSGAAEAGMGVELADLDGDGRQDLVVTNFALETNALYRNAGGGVFLDRRFPAGLAQPSLQRLAFGVNAFDADLDGDLDLFVANGHIQPRAADISEVGAYEQPNQLFENLGGGRFRERHDVGLEPVRTSRGSAVADLDLDGDLDLVAVNSNQVAEAYENRASGAWFALAFAPRAAQPANGTSSAPAPGVRLELTAGGTTQVRETRAGSSYLSQSTLAALFGLGRRQRIDRVVVRPPTGGHPLALLDLPSGRRALLRR
ncbi:MAG: CRTAC1 family protein [Acidobacteriota bacterium]|nr:CRTAC1 family protein [Acidobacteriota bacterium]